LKLAVVSNFDSRLPGILRDLGIGRRVDAVVYSTEARCAKPAPAIFTRTLDLLRVDPDRAIHVGDSAAADIDGAAAAGIAALLIKRDVPPVEVTGRVIRSLDALLNLISVG
jgi:putative hydrolase of the HAD superfamily